MFKKENINRGFIVLTSLFVFLTVLGLILLFVIGGSKPSLESCANIAEWYDEKTDTCTEYNPNY